MCVPEKLRDDFEKDFAGISNIEPIFVNYEKFSMKGFFTQLRILRKLEKRVVNLFFYPHINLPYYIPKNTIVTIHDLRPLTQFWDRSEIKRKIFIFYLKRALKHAKKIVTISNTVAKELQEKYQRINNKIGVIYRFTDNKFIDCKRPNKRIIENPYLLFIGNRKKYKNLETLIKAFAKVKDKIPHYLVIAGAKDREKDEVDNLVEKLSIQNRVIQLIKLDDETIINLYSFADLFVFPSLFEGFDLSFFLVIIIFFIFVVLQQGIRDYNAVGQQYTGSVIFLDLSRVAEYIIFTAAFFAYIGGWLESSRISPSIYFGALEYANVSSLGQLWNLFGVIYPFVLLLFWWLVTRYWQKFDKGHPDGLIVYLFLVYNLFEFLRIFEFTTITGLGKLVLLFACG